MDLMISTFETMVFSFTNEDELMNFAATWGIQDSDMVRFRLFQLRNPEYGAGFVQEQLDTLLEHFGEPSTSDGPSRRVDIPLTSDLVADLDLATEYVAQQEELKECVKAFLFDQEMEETARLCVEDGPWSPASPEQLGAEEQPGPSGLQEYDILSNASPVQLGAGKEPGASDLQYTFRKKSERTYAKNAAVDTTYQVKVHDQHQGQRLQDIRQGLHQLFDDVLNQARGAGNDLGRVIIHHEGLNNLIIVPLQPWDQLNADTVMETVEAVLNSNEELEMDDSFDITVGSIDLPKGGTRRRITRLKGDKNSLQLKTSLVDIQNEDQLCMARAIGVSWAKLKRCNTEEWKEITKTRGEKSNLDLILEHQRVPLTFYKHLTNKNRNEQRQLAVAISELANVPLDRPASLNDVSAFEQALGVRVMVISARLGNKFITSPSTNELPCIYIYLVDDDHFHAITSITGFFSAMYFCSKCLKHYNNRIRHQCELTCVVCKRDNCPETDTMLSCRTCHMTCRSIDCFQRHKLQPKHRNGPRKGKPRGPSQCQIWWKCPKCYKVLETAKRAKEHHRCGEYYCLSCEQYVLDGHLCYLRATPAKEDFIPNFIFFDFECSQDETMECDEGYKTSHCEECSPEKLCKQCSKCQNCNISWCGKATHRPNFVVAHTVCSKCINQPLNPESLCRNCGTQCEVCYNEDTGPCPGKCGRREVIFEGEDTVKKFGQWLFSDQHRYFTAVAHNMKGYDGYFLLEYLIDNAMRPDKIIYNGSKIMYMTVDKGLHIKVIDSLNFLPMKLSALPKAFGLGELKKGWFPHFFNTRKNQNYIGHYPEPQFYGVDFMGSRERDDLINWLQTQKHETFDFRKEMLEYCRSDVDILRQACLQFQYLLMSATGTQEEKINDKGKIETVWVGAVDPFSSVTIASVCMNVYRTKFLEEEWRVKVDKKWIPAKKLDGKMYICQDEEWIAEEKADVKITGREFVSTPIAKIPPGGYKKDQYSKCSIQWLEWMSFLTNINIQHAVNGGEKALLGTRYKLDGYCAETNTAYEFHGCVFHGCPNCFDEDTIHPLTRQSMKELHALTLKKRTYIKSLGMKYVCIWEHEFQQQMDKNTDMKTFINHLDIEDRLNPRDSFFGGRTNASQLYYKVKEKEKIKYVDFTSLYPWVNKYCQYPVGHPTIITKDFENIDKYFGIAKVKIVPPRGLYHPVLPYRSNGKLKFPLCRTCADNENQDPCTCTNEQRMLIGTWCTPEIIKAIRMGYVVLKIYEVFHWKQTTQYNPTTQEGGLFASYVNTFLKFKQEASGHPDWIKTEEDVDKYIQQYFAKEGVSLESADIVKNPGLRALAKLCLNSFWGKFGQRLNMRQTEFFHESQVDQFFQIFTDPMKQTQNFHIVAEDTLQMEWIYKNDCVPEDNKTNIYLATFTTCWARLKLYSVLEDLDRRVLYYDTDSVIYVSQPGQYDPPLGDYLGELTDELSEGEYIVEFVSGGPKNYAYRTNTGKEMCKVRGFTLNYTNSQLINFESVKQIVTDPKAQSTITTTNPKKICRDKRKRKLYNREEKKSYQMVYTKRRRLNNNDTVPYGF